jgi:hypothetical protein
MAEKPNNPGRKKNKDLHSVEKNLPTSIRALKKIDEYKQSKPVQLNLFEMLSPQDREFSNTIELYDFIPKYFWGKSQRINGKFLDQLEREFECRSVRYKVKIDPAKISDRDGVTRDYYPSKREELVEDALRKFACEGQGLFLDDQAGVTFTLYQIHQELKRLGHTYSIREIKDALLICAKTNITVSTEDGKAILVSSLFETLGLQTREDWQGQGEKTKAFVRFNSLVTQSIRQQTFRQLNYDKAMLYKSVIARQLHKRMAHHYPQASFSNPYHFLLSTIIRDFGLTEYAQLRDNLRDVQAALDEMKEKEIIMSYQIQKTLDSKRRNKLIDAKFILTPDAHFISEVIRANKRQMEFKKISA